MKLRPFSVLFALLASSVTAEAKLVELRWTEVQGAVGYEIEVHAVQGKSDKEAKPKTLKVERAWWKGDLGFGAYSYRVRAVDKIQRGGVWSDDSPLVVTPPAAEPEAPESGQKFAYFGNRSPEVRLKWKPIDGILRYRVEVARGKQVVLNMATRGNGVKIPKLDEGDYSWRVASIVDIPDLPEFAVIEMREWQSKFGKESEFEVERRTLGQPVLKFPLGRATAPKDGGPLTFQWKAIDGATKYEVVLEDDGPKPEGRNPASAEPPLYSTEVDGATTSISIPAPKTDRNYRWRVRAIAGEEVGPDSYAQFKLDAPARFHAKSGKVRIAPSYYPFNMTFQNANRTGSLSGIGLATSVYAQYWFMDRWGSSVAIETHNFGLSNTTFSRMGVDGYASARFSLGFLSAAGRFWSTHLHLGYGYHQFFDLDFVSPTQGREVLLSSHGPAARAEIEGDITQRLGFSALASLFLPSRLNGVEASGSRFSLGGELNYRAWKTWRVGLGAQIDQLAVEYNPGAGLRRVQLSGLRLLVGLTYGFGGSTAESNSTSFVNKNPDGAEKSELDSGKHPPSARAPASQ